MDAVNALVPSSFDSLSFSVVAAASSRGRVHVRGRRPTHSVKYIRDLMFSFCFFYDIKRPHDAAFFFFLTTRVFNPTITSNEMSPQADLQRVCKTKTKAPAVMKSQPFVMSRSPIWRVCGLGDPLAGTQSLACCGCCCMSFSSLIRAVKVILLSGICSQHLRISSYTCRSRRHSGSAGGQWDDGKVRRLVFRDPAPAGRLG